MNRSRIFLSAVSEELATARLKVSNIVQRFGYDVISQDNFETGYGELCCWLSEKIDSCEGLIQLVGKAILEKFFGDILLGLVNRKRMMPVTLQQAVYFWMLAKHRSDILSISSCLNASFAVNTTRKTNKMHHFKSRDFKQSDNIPEK